MQILITGLGGFVGRHLAQHLLEAVPHAVIHGTTLALPPQPDARVTYHTLDMRNEGAVRELMARVQPEQIYHLAAQAFVPRSFEDPWETLENNIRAQLNIILACLALRINPPILIVGSAEIYGTLPPEHLPAREDAPLRPSSPYSVSKIAQDMLGLQYFVSHQLPIMRARPFNHFGPGQDERFVAPAFAMQIARIEAGLQLPVIRVGDLSAQRDFTDVRDVVRAYHLIVERGTPGEAYNVASGAAYSIQTLLDGLLSHSTAKISVEIDPVRVRPTLLPVLWGDASKLRAATGWQPTISFQQSLRDVLNDCRQHVRS